MKKRFCRTNCATNCAPQRARRVRNWYRHLFRRCRPARSAACLPSLRRCAGIEYHARAGQSVHGGRNAMQDERCGFGRRRRCTLDGHSNQRSAHYARCRRLSAVCRWKDCRGHRRGRRYGSAGLRDRRTCGERVREFRRLKGSGLSG